MSGIEGVYIRRKYIQSPLDGNLARMEFVIEPHLSQPSCDYSLGYMVSKMLPLCSNHDAILQFVNMHVHFEFGLVSHALCDAIRALLKEYLLLVT